jgi:hypothetical protein
MGNLNGFLGYASDEYGIAIGESTKYLKYDPTNGLRIAGSIENLSFFTAGMNLTQGQAVFIHTDGLIYSTDATASSSTATFIGFCVTTTTAGSTAPIMMVGNFSYLSSLSTGVAYYLKDAVQTVDQQQTTDDSQTEIPNGSETSYQSFTVGNGVTHLTKVDVKLQQLTGFADGQTIRIRSGEGTGGTLLYTGSFTVDSSNVYEHTLTSFVPVTAGQKYSITLQATNLNRVAWRRNSAGGYSGGRNDGSANTDYYFRTYYGTSRGLINTSAGTVSKKVGLALSSTSLLILNS